MTRIDWLNKVTANADALKTFIASFHPINLIPKLDKDIMSPDITAPQAERACEVVRNQIRSESMERPDIQFDIALKNADAEVVMSLLSSAWFGGCCNIHCK